VSTPPIRQRTLITRLVGESLLGRARETGDQARRGSRLLSLAFAVVAQGLFGCESGLDISSGEPLPDGGAGSEDAGSGTLIIVDSDPLNHARSVEPPDVVMFTFGEDISAGAGSITLLESFDNIVVEQLDVTGSHVVFAGRELRIEWQTQLALDTEYTVVLESGAVLGVNGGSFDGLTVPGSFSFTTMAPDPLQLKSSAPKDGATGVSLTTAVRLTFSSDVMAGAVGDIRVVQNDNQMVVQTDAVATSEHVVIDGDELSLQLAEPLQYATDYVVMLDDEAVRGLDGARFSGGDDSVVLAFSTKAPPALDLVGTNPLTDAMQVDPRVSLVLTFSEPIELGTGAVVVRDAADNSTFETVDVGSSAVTANDVWITVDLGNVLDGDTTYYVNVSPGAVRSVRGAEFAGVSDDTTFRFTTAEMPPPELTIATSAPLAGAKGVAVDADLVLTFSESVSVGTGTVNLHRASDGMVFESISVDDPRVEVTSTTATVNPTATLDGNTEYYVTITPGAFVSGQGASFGGITTAADLSFTTVSTFSLLEREPVDGDVAVPVDSALVLTFSENAEARSGDVTIFDEDADAPFATLAVDGSAIDISGAVMTITPPMPFAEGVKYSVVLESGAVGEVGGVAFTGLSQRGDWQFTSYSTCDKGEYVRVAGGCYFATAGAVTWQTARDACQARGAGWDLASIRSNAEQQALNQLLTQAVPDQELWFGASDLAVEGRWRWVTDDVHFWTGDPGGSAVGGAYTNWRGSEPSGAGQNCGRLIPENSDWKWADADCGNEYGFVCQGPVN